MRLPWNFKMGARIRDSGGGTVSLYNENDARMFNVNLSLATAPVSGGRGVQRNWRFHRRTPRSRRASVVVNYASSTSGAEEIVRRIIEKGCKTIAVQADVPKPPGFALHFHSRHHVAI
jgi:hypothetical protein